MGKILTDDECVEAVREALDSLPAEVVGQLGDVAVVVEDRHPLSVLENAGSRVYQNALTHRELDSLISA